MHVIDQQRFVEVNDETVPTQFLRELIQLPVDEAVREYRAAFEVRRN